MIFAANKQAFDFPSASVATKLPAILGSLFAAVFSIWSNHFNVPFDQKPLIKAIAVICLIANNTIRRISGKDHVVCHLLAVQHTVAIFVFVVIFFNVISCQMNENL